MSRSNSFEPKFHRHFDARAVLKISDFVSIITKAVWSPIIWKEGLRRRDHFAACKYAALDFDDGRWTLDDAQRHCRENKFSFIIGTSKSHQKEKKTLTGKVSPPCDRFRLVIPFDRLVTDRFEYEASMRHLTDVYPCDPACVDAARFFYPCKEIVAWFIDEAKLPVQDGAVVAEELEAVEGRQAEAAALARETGIIPSWVAMVLRAGVGPDQSRHQMSYRLGATLTGAGWSEEAVVAAIMRSPIGAIGPGDVRRAVRNGAEKALEQLKGAANG